MPRWFTPFRLIADLLMPRACAGCERILTQDEARFCPLCAELLLADCGIDYCTRCGRTAEPYLATAEGCPECRHTRRLDGFARVGTYAGFAGNLVRRFKFEGHQRLDGILGSLLADAIRRQPWCEQIEALVPVPADWRGWWRYGFHPAGLIAKSAGSRLGLPVFPLVRLQRKPRRQTGLSKSERILNIRGAFRMARAARVKNASVCIIDDVSTSGATVREVGRVLRAAGAASVFAAVIARTQFGPTPATTGSSPAAQA